VQLGTAHSDILGQLLDAKLVVSQILIDLSFKFFEEQIAYTVGFHKNYTYVRVMPKL